ncbi:LysE family translocator [Roseomonas sp. HF4]|uniref:LysE family translocator n=1 Tax=Roseomonas sp. HF4 TaxID=2562313 RepID=UPI0010C0B2E7|nr:LysE family translocator [Roseomonas sp. HF4]
MVDPTALLIYAAAALLLAVTPGPGIFYVAARSLAGGRAEGVASSLGTGLGGMVHVGAGAVGVSALVLASAEAFLVVKLAGATYLVWIGIRTFREARHASVSLPAEQTRGGAPGRAFREGIAVEALNPKTAAFFLAFVPQFVDPAAGHVAVQFIVLGLVSVALNTGVDILVALGAGGIRRGLSARPGLLLRLRQGSGAMLCALGAALALVRRPAA